MDARSRGERGRSISDEPLRRRAFATLHASAARPVQLPSEEIAVGSSATELLASLAWAVAPTAGSKHRQHRSRVSQHDLPVGARRAPHGSRGQTRRHEGRLSSGRRSDWPDRSQDRRRLRLRCDLQPGQRLDVGGLAEAAHRNGALLIIDARSRPAGSRSTSGRSGSTR